MNLFPDLSDEPLWFRFLAYTILLPFSMAMIIGYLMYYIEMSWISESKKLLGKK